MVLELLGPNLEVGNFSSCPLALFNLLCTGPVQPVWEKIQHKNSFSHWDPACLENGNDPLQRIDIQVLSRLDHNADGHDDDDYYNYKLYCRPRTSQIC